MTVFDVVANQNGNTVAYSNVAFDTINDMQAWVAQIPATLVSYTIQSSQLDVGIPSSSAITYNTVLRDTTGATKTSTVQIPYTTNDGIQINNISDFANFVAQQGWLFMSANVQNGAAGATAPTVVPTGSTITDYVFDVNITHPDGSPGTLYNLSFTSIAALVEYVHQLPAQLIDFMIVSGPYSGTVGLLFDASGNPVSGPPIPNYVPPTQAQLVTMTAQSNGSAAAAAAAAAAAVAANATTANPSTISATTANSSAGENGPTFGNTSSPATSASPASAGGSTVYRLILATLDSSSPSGYTYNTGATYAQCSINNPSACNPMSFTDLASAQAYANANDEIPVIVNSVDQAWAVVAGQQPVPSSGGLGLSTNDLLIAAALAYFIIMR